MSKPTVISTFAGPGGSSIGYERAGFDVRAALDCAPGKFSNAIIPTYKKNHPDTVHVTQDARETSADELLDAAELERGEVDVIDGSPPCSPFSGANTQTAWRDHESGTLFDRYTYFIKEIQPRIFVAENVPGLAEGKTKGYYKRLCQNLQSAGYNLRVQKIDAAYLGAPHHRRRLMFIGVREDIGEPPKIEPTSQPTTVREAWDNLEQSSNSVNREKKRMEQSKNYEYMCQTPPSQRLCDATPSNNFDDRRLHYRKPSPTITAQTNLIHPKEDRFITIAELKRLIGLSDDYQLPDAHSSAWECAIRCLPPVLLETIGAKLRETVL